VRNLDEAIAQYRRAFKLAEPHRERDSEFNAKLAWFDGTPIVLAQGLTADSWLTQRVNRYGDLPCAIVLAAKGGLAGGQASEWFGRKISWVDTRVLGWHLGMEAAR
jgi:hypothetical protein